MPPRSHRRGGYELLSIEEEEKEDYELLRVEEDKLLDVGYELFLVEEEAKLLDVKEDNLLAASWRRTNASLTSASDGKPG